MPQFAEMTTEQALDYVHKHKRDWFRDSDGGDVSREWDCLISCIESGTIKPEQLPDYGFYYE